MWLGNPPVYFPSDLDHMTCNCGYYLHSLENQEEKEDLKHI